MPEAIAVDERAGLFTSAAQPVPLLGVRAEVEIGDLCARVVLTQRYRNVETGPIEAVYLFPLDEGAAVCGFEAHLGDRVIVAEAMEREEAFATYDDALQAGHGAFLLDEERPDVFQVSVGNLLPGNEVLLKVTYVTELDVAEDAIRFVLPTTVSPRYAPAADRAGLGRPDADTLNPPRDAQVPYGLELAVTVKTTGGVGRVESPSHPIAVQLDGDRVAVGLSQAAVTLDRDFVLTIGTAGLDVPSAWIEKDADGAAIAVSWVPSVPDARRPVEVIFVVDESGSMSGDSIAQVRNALQVCLRSLSAGCRFNIFSFGTTCASLFPASCAYDEASLDAASRFVAAMSANRGGTEILFALSRVFATPVDPALSRQVVVLTDGQVTNTDDVLALVRSHAGSTRVFAFGIGHGAGRHLVKGMARAGGGAAEFIAPDERIEPKVIRTIGRLLAPCAADVAIDWGGLEAVMSPAEVPPIFSGGRIVVYGRVAALTPATVRLTANGPDGPLAYEVTVDPARAAEGTTVATLAARFRIRDLEESPEWTRARASRQGRGRLNRVSREIVDLAVRHGLASRETSLVAVERRESPATGELQLRRVPLAMTRGWGGVSDMLFEDSLNLGSAVQDFHPRTISRAARFDVPLASSQMAPVFRRRAAVDDSSRNRAVAVITLQQVDGSWDLSRDLAAALNRQLKDLTRACPAAAAASDTGRRAWATALALAWLQREASGVADEWRLVAEKAQAWLAAQADGPVADECRTTALALVGTP